MITLQDRKQHHVDLLRGQPSRVNKNILSHPEAIARVRIIPFKGYESTPDIDVGLLGIRGSGPGNAREDQEARMAR